MELSSKGSIYQNKDYLSLGYSFRSKLMFLTDEEFHSHVLECIWRANEKFDSTNNTKFETYLYITYRNLFYRLIKIYYKGKENTLLSSSKFDVEEIRDERFENEKNKQEVLDVINQLPEQNRDFLYSKFFLQETEEQICDNLNLTKGELATIKKHSYRLFKRHYTNVPA